MRNNKKIAVSLLLLPLLALSACNDGGNSSSSETKSEISSQSESSETLPSSSEDKSSEESSTPVVIKHKVTFHLYGDKKEVKEVKHNELVSKPTNPQREGYLFAGWFTSKDGIEEFYFGTKIIADTDIYAHWSEDVGISMEAFKKALKADYSNSVVKFDSTAEIKDPYMVTNVDGYNIAEGLDGENGDGHYLYYHDYNGKSYNYFNDATHGGAWIRQGKKFESGAYASLGIDHIYFKADIHLALLNPNDFVYKAGSFHLLDATKVNEAVDRGAFDYFYENQVAQVSIILNEANTHVEKIITYDSANPDDPRHTVLQIEKVNQVPSWAYSTLPEAPNENNVKTWYEWKNEEEPTFEKLITSMEVSLKEGQSSEIYVDEEIKLKYALNPIKPDRKDLELKFEGDQENFEFKYDFGDNNLRAKAFKSGTYKVYLHDKISKIDSNKLEIVVKDTRDSKFNSDSALYNAKLDYDANGNLILVNTLNENKVTFKNSPKCFELADGFQSSDNPKLDAFTQGMRFNFCINDSMYAAKDDSYVIFELDKDVNAMSFTYGALFANHVERFRRGVTNTGVHDFKATIQVSSDGQTFTEAEDWTNEVEKEISSYTLRRKDIEFDSATKFVKIAFDSQMINNGLSVCMDSWQFFNITK